MDIRTLIPNPNNPRTITKERFNKLVARLKSCPDTLEFRPIVIRDNIIVCGNMRHKALLELGYTDIPDEWVKDCRKLTDEQIREFIVVDNIEYGTFDFDVACIDYDMAELKAWGVENVDYDQKADDPYSEGVKGSLEKKFIAPPFSVLDTRQGYWQDRKNVWKDLIGDFGESREKTLSGDGIMKGINNGVSIFDPVLAELIIKWFGFDKCKIFDCFAGDSVIGFVSAYNDNIFTGIELRQEQVDLNNSRIKKNKSIYICDDGQNVSSHIKSNSQDLLVSCPPYFDLEIYSDLPNDASNQNSYKDFLNILDNAYSASIKCLKDNRFAVIVAGDIRDEKGFYRGFCDDIKNIFIQNGMLLYNELILVEMLGTAPVRANKLMEYRKAVKCHQNVLVFYKGDPKQIKKNFPKLEFEEI